MNMKALYSTALLAVLASGNLYAKCTSPASPGKMPRGKTATADQMAAAQKTVKDFDTATNQYITCLESETDAEIAALAQSETDQKKREEKREKLLRNLVKKQNAAVDVDKAMAERFNEQVRAFKAKEAAKGDAG